MVCYALKTEDGYYSKDGRNVYTHSLNDALLWDSFKGAKNERDNSKETVVEIEITETGSNCNEW